MVGQLKNRHWWFFAKFELLGFKCQTSDREGNLDIEGWLICMNERPLLVWSRPGRFERSPRDPIFEKQKHVMNYDHGKYCFEVLKAVWTSPLDKIQWMPILHDQFTGQFASWSFNRFMIFTTIATFWNKKDKTDCKILAIKTVLSLRVCLFHM